MKYDTIGYSIAIAGSFLSIVGALINNLWLNHTLAMWCWLFSNPALFLWAYGNIKGWWNSGISVEALAVMYVVFSVSNFYGLFFGGLV